VAGELVHTEGSSEGAAVVGVRLELEDHDAIDRRRHEPHRAERSDRITDRTGRRTRVRAS
jgi:hypothetical protein